MRSIASVTSRSSRPRLDELDLVAIRILHERDHGRAVLHRAGLADHGAALLLDRRTRCVRVVHLDSDVTVPAADLVRPGVPVVGQLEDGPFRLRTVANEGKGELAVGMV